MDTALITGMFETSFLPNKQVGLDVKDGSTESFGKILESSLKNNDVVKNEAKDCKISEDVSVEQLDGEETEIEVADEEINDEESTKDVTNIVDELLNGIKEDEGKPKKKDKKVKEDNSLNNFAQQKDLTKLIKKDNLIKEDVETQVEDVKLEEVVTKDVNTENKDVIKLIGTVKNEKLEITPEEKLDNLLNKLDVKLTQNVKIKDDGEQVIEVGPQSVETEKIELNIKDVKSNTEVEEKNIDINYEKLNAKQGNIVASKDKNIDIPTIQNPFKLKRLSEEKETNELSQEIIPMDEESVNTKDVDNKILDLTSGKEEALETEIIESEDLTTEVKAKKDVNQKITDVNEDNSTDVLKENDIDHTELNKKNFNNKEDSNKKDSNSKEDKIKVKDFRNKKEVDFKQDVFAKEDVKIENKFEIKEVNNVRKFENFVEQDILDQVTESLDVSLFDNKSEMVIKLKPNDLGSVTVKISIENGVMNAKFLADSTKVKEALESNLNNLKESLKDQGLNVQDLSVSVDSGRSQNNQTFEQNRLVYFNNKTDYQNDKAINYEDTYYEFSNINTNNVKNYWMDSTVSFLA